MSRFLRFALVASTAAAALVPDPDRGSRTRRNTTTFLPSIALCPIRVYAAPNTAYTPVHPIGPESAASAPYNRHVSCGNASRVLG